jgi:hypothetical protein
MIFTIKQYSKKDNRYIVSDELGKEVVATEIQIVKTMIQGYTYTNARPTGKGFGYQSGYGMNFVQVDGLSKEDKIVLKSLAAEIAARDKAVKQPQPVQSQVKVNQSKSPTPQTQNIPQQFNKNRVEVKKRAKAVARVTPDKNRIPNGNIHKSLNYRGEVFLSDEELCRKYNRDLRTYRELISQGQSIGSALGQLPLRNNTEFNNQKSLAKMLDSMESHRSY